MNSEEIKQEETQPNEQASIDNQKLARIVKTIITLENNNVKTSTTVPDFKGMTAAQAINSAISKKLNVVLNGKGIVISQDTASNSEIEIGSVITLNLSDELNGGY